MTSVGGRVGGGRVASCGARRYSIAGTVVIYRMKAGDSLRFCSELGTLLASECFNLSHYPLLNLHQQFRTCT